MDDEWIDLLVRRAAQEVMGSKQFKGTLVATGYKPDAHAIKGIIVPHGVESGWVPIATHHTGNGFGILMGPKVGDAKKLDGDQFDIEFDLGDPNTIVARHRQFSTPDKPPKVESGEMLIQQEGGNKLFMAKDKSITITHGPSGSNITWDKDGNITHDTKGKTLTVKTGGAALTVDAGGGPLKLKGAVAINGS